MFQIAADNHKHPRAQYQVGEMLMHGRGTFQDPIQAFRYFKAAADQGLVEAAFQTGVMFHKGKVVDQDLLQATHYLQKATSANYKPALRYMRQVYKRGGMRTRDALLFEDVSKPTLMKTIGRKLSKLQRVMQMGCMKSEIDEISTH